MRQYILKVVLASELFGGTEHFELHFEIRTTNDAFLSIGPLKRRDENVNYHF